jgi:hypothetical protein
MFKLMIALLAGAGLTLAGCATQPGPTTAEAKRDADYWNAVRKCDDLGSAERSGCIYDAKERYGKS